MFQKILTKLFGDPNERELQKLWPLVSEINKIEAKYQETLKDEYFPAKTEEFKKRIANGESLEKILPEAFALVKNACRRLIGKKWMVRNREITWDMIPFDVQLLGGIVLHNGKIAEMKTGEGKTLVCTMPIYLNALTGRGVYLVTVNDYLAHRDAEWMGGLYKFLGLSVGVIHHGQSPDEKKEAYGFDITYGTNNEFGFDYLRDNMAVRVEDIVQRELFYAIVDEVDSILIDEARTPLIISSPAQESTLKYKKYSQLIPQLEQEKDFVIDEKQRVATLTEAGIKHMEELLGLENIYTEAGFEEVHHIEQALKAQAIFKLDIDYVVNNGEVIIVDEFTGRLMPGRRYSEGLHQAIEAKEAVEIKRESRTLATISFQNYFRLFEKLAGMTGTAVTEAEEFAKIYKLDTFVIPTNLPVVRSDNADLVFKNTQGKLAAVAKKVKELFEKGQPVLIGTISIEKSEHLSKILEAAGVPHTVLNAKYHEKEAEIVAKAGLKGAVTIATNMAGRGTDIKLGEGVRERSGLFVLGTERHESRRIDNQLRGRSGRQGDPGASQFFVSLDDELMRLFGGERVQRMMGFLKIPDDMPIESRAVSDAIEKAQKKVEARNFELRKYLVEYDDVMNKHREIIYKRRRKILFSQEIKNDILLLIEEEAEAIVQSLAGGREKEEWDFAGIVSRVNAVHTSADKRLDIETLTAHGEREEVIESVKHYLWNEYKNRERLLPDNAEKIGSQILRELERNVYMRTLDMLWMDHLDEISRLRESVSLSGYAQHDPLITYKEQAYRLMVELLAKIRSATVNTLFKLEFREKEGTAAPAAPLSQRLPLQTNESEIEDILTGDRELVAERPRAQVPIKKGPQPGRNDPCPCGSGKKFKKCHA